MTDFTPETPVLTPIRDHAAELAKAEAGVAEMAAKRNNRWYPKYHIASNGGWINDPNGLCFYKGRWHVFYQLHPYGTQWGPMHWGHVSSTDMLNWKREPIMFAPSLEQEKDGVFSGSAVIDDNGDLRFYYTGHRWANGHDNTGGDWQVQMTALPDNDELTSATKQGMIIDCPTDKVDHHYRDPKVWKTGDTWYMTFGVSSADKRGQMWLFSSKDMVRWEYERVLFQHPDPDVFMLECPDFFPIKDKDGNVIVKANHMITPKRAARVIKDGINENGEHYTKVKIRTILTCRSGNGICAKCYGANMATGEAVQVGESVGIIAAQSIGEPGTQLTMRTFHTGGVAGGDITQGLPRVEELFEARKPKGLAIITEIAGVAQIKDTKKKREIVVTNPEDGVSKTYLIPYGSRIKIADGTVLEAGDELTEGSVNPHDILKIKGVRAVQDYMIREVQRVYRLQGVEINDKHIEVIVRQMLKKIRIEENGDTEFLPGDMVDFLDYDETNKALIAEGKEPAEGKQVLLGITKASLASDSFLSAASFQETTKVLTDAAIKGKVDHLVGLKENVIIGKPIPAGTGMKCYSNIHLNTDSMIEEEEDDLILTEDLEDDAPADPMAEAPVEEPSAEEEEPMLDFDFEEMIPSKDDTEE